jgi:lipid-A-disaccharide synthase
VVMDYPDFNLMLAKKLHAAGIPVVYYISPQVWAWRKGRVNKIKKFCRKVLVLFPFEVPFYEAKKVPVEFVGHPLLDELPEKYFLESYRQFHREKFGIHKDEIVLGLMPGSRRSELKHNLPVQMQAAGLLCKKFPKIKVAILVAPTFSKEQVQAELTGDYSFSYILLKDEPGEMIHLTDYIIVASGTATLMVGLLHKPMVIMYHVKRATILFGKLIGFKVAFFGLPNLILGRMVVPECIQTPAQSLFEEIKKYLQDTSYSDSVRQELAKLQPLLGEKGATQRVARALDEFLGDP